MKGQKRWLGLVLALCLCLGLAAPAAAVETLPEMPDVFQGDGVYVTAKELPIPEGWSVYGGVPRGVHEGFVTVFRTEDVQDEDGFYTGGKRYLVNWVDENGNLFDFSDWETPPTLYGYSPYDYDSYNFHDGLCYFYDEEKEAFGYIDTEGNRVIEASQYGVDFYNGLARVNYDTFIDKTGEVVFSLDDLGWEGTIMGEYSDGLFAYRGYLDADRDTYFVGWLNLDGEPVITLYSGDWLDYNRNEDLDFGTTTFSDGYAFVEDNRGGGSYPDYILIDTKGSEVLTVEPKAPAYIYGIGGGEDNGADAAGKVRGGRFWVWYMDTTPGLSGDEANYSILMDVEGNEFFRDVGYEMTGGYFDNGVAVDRYSVDAKVIDIDGNTVVPDFTEEQGNGRFNVTVEFNEDNQTLAYLSRPNNAGDTYYILEAHDGTYTGSGRVYDAATKTIRDGGGTQPTDPEPSADQPSSWAQAQVNEAISAGLVPDALQSSYTTPATRSEFCALAAELYETVLDTEITERATFTDTTDVNVEKMAGLGVVNGVGNGQFNPSGQITRQEAAALLSRLAQVMGHPLSGQTPDYADAAEISAWAAEAVGQMQAAGIMNGIEGNRFAPRDPYTREQSIMTVLRLYNIVK